MGTEGAYLNIIKPTANIILKCERLKDFPLRSRTRVGFPGGTVVKNPPANAGDMGLSSGPGRSHMPRSN